MRQRSAQDAVMGLFNAIGGTALPDTACANGGLSRQATEGVTHVTQPGNQHATHRSSRFLEEIIDSVLSGHSAFDSNDQTAGGPSGLQCGEADSTTGEQEKRTAS